MKKRVWIKIDDIVLLERDDYNENNGMVVWKYDQSEVKTLKKMANGGIFDQIGGGFHRYSTDTKWLVPHFEKMILENSLLVSCFSRAFRKYKKPLYQKVISKTIFRTKSTIENVVTRFQKTLYEQRG